MSHSVNIKTQFKNITGLCAEFGKLNWITTENTTRRTYPSDPSRNEPCRYVMKNPKADGYDIGINLDTEGNAAFVLDFYDRSIEQQLGRNLQKIKQGYALSELKKFMHMEDLNYNVKTLPSGELMVTAEK